MRDFYIPSETVGWTLPLGRAIERAHAYLQGHDDNGLSADPTMSYRKPVPLSRANALLDEVGLPPIDWSNTNPAEAVQ